MNKNSLPLFVGVIISVMVILLLSDLTIIDDCIAQGGHFDYQKAQCLLANNEVYTSRYINYLITAYFVIGLVLALIISRLIKKVFKINT